MRKISYTMLILILAASSLTFGVTTAYLYNVQARLSGDYELLRQNYASLQAKYEQIDQTYHDLTWQYEYLRWQYEHNRTKLCLFDSSRSILPGHPSEVPNVLITYPDGFQDYAVAILKICDTALSKYVEVFGMSTSDIHVLINTSSSDLSLGCSTGDYRIFLYLPGERYFRPPPYGPNHVYGYIHEIGHLMFLTYNEGFNEGWSHYTASKIVDQVYHELGDDAWPQPYNYSRTEGMERFLRDINDPSKCQPNTVYAAGKILYTIEQRHGPAIFKSAIDKMQPTYIGMYRHPLHRLEEFRNALAELTNDTGIIDLFSENGF